MSQDMDRTNVTERTQQLLQGRLRRVKAAGLAMALVPLAAVAVTTAEPQFCSSAGMVCGTVWQDTNHNGIQDADEPGIANAIVTLGEVSKATNEFGYYEFLVRYGEYKIDVQIPPGTQPSPVNAGSADTLDSDGVPDGLGNGTATVTYESPSPTMPPPTSASGRRQWCSPARARLATGRTIRRHGRSLPSLSAASPIRRHRPLRSSSAW